MEETVANDPWAEDKNQQSNESVALSFESSFSHELTSKNNKNGGSTDSILDDAYSEKLEQKLERLQRKKGSNSSGKDMLNNFKSQREMYMTNLLESPSITPYVNHGNVENPTFFENLYQTNSVYRHMNPQQALESSEKLPIVQHDQLSNERVEDGEQDKTKQEMTNLNVTGK